MERISANDANVLLAGGHVNLSFVLGIVSGFQVFGCQCAAIVKQLGAFERTPRQFLIGAGLLIIGRGARQIRA